MGPAPQVRRGGVTTSAFVDEGPLARVLSRLVHLERGEAAALLLSFLYFFLVLAAYYIIRPVRDAMGATLGKGGLEQLFTIVFLVMLAAVPVYGFVVSRFPRRWVVPIVYLFFASQLVGFWMALSSGFDGPKLAAVFFVWVSVFNLFVVSLFWITMSDLWQSEQAKRLYGFIAAGGSAGALAGPLITQGLVGIVGANALLLISAALLTAAMAAALAVRRYLGAESEGQAGQQQVVTARSVLAGAVEVFRSPYLASIAAWVLLANLVSTLFYLEQTRIVAETLTSQDARVTLFSRIDLAVSILTILAQVLVTGRLLERIGVGVAAAAAPAWATLGLVALAVSPTLGVVVAVLAVERAIGFAFSNPAVKVLYTVLGREEKYKAQSFVDTVVFRGGDAASGWLINGLKAAGLGTAGAAAAVAPLGLAWLGLSLWLGKRQGELARNKV
jgi:AAA family ATP:ADP antiporter